MKHKGFTLIELLVAIAIIAVLMAFALPNYLGARERARDSKKKSELNQLKNALRMYYGDYQKYPARGNCGGGDYKISGCGTEGTSCCPCVFGSSSFDFAVGASCNTIYMKKFISSLTAYKYNGTSDMFCAQIVLENKSDPDKATSQLSCSSVCSSLSMTCSSDYYCVCSD